MFKTAKRRAKPATALRHHHSGEQEEMRRSSDPDGQRQKTCRQRLTPKHPLPILKMSLRTCTTAKDHDDDRRHHLRLIRYSKNKCVSIMVVAPCIFHRGSNEDNNRRIKKRNRFQTDHPSPAMRPCRRSASESHPPSGGQSLACTLYDITMTTWSPPASAVNSLLLVIPCCLPNEMKKFEKI